MEELAAPRAGRLCFIDGLRGIASAIVAVFHFYVFGHLTLPLSRVFPHAIAALLIHGNVGVSIFFVISGFVMALSQRGVGIDLKYLGNFALRRSLRLDPPYWITLWTAVILDRAVGAHVGGIGKHPSIANVLISMVYLQGLLRRPEVLNVAWTLCYEVQFYLVLTVVCGLAQRVMPRRWHRAYLLLFLPSGVWSIAIYTQLLPSPLTGLFIDRWFMFVMGCLAFWVWDCRVHPAWLWVFTVSVASLIWYRFDYEGAASVASVILIGLVSLWPGWLENGLRTPPLQFLGRISYSLYLVHTIVGMKLMWLAARYVHDSSALAVLMFLVACTTSILTAWGLYVGVEKWGISLGRRIKRS